jgi:spore maturation protein SpmA
MKILAITPFHILFTIIGIAVLYISVIRILVKTRSGILPYLALILFPIFGPLGIVFGNYFNKK